MYNCSSYIPHIVLFVVTGHRPGVSFTWDVLEQGQKNQEVIISRSWKQKEALQHSTVRLHQSEPKLSCRDLENDADWQDVANVKDVAIYRPTDCDWTMNFELSFRAYCNCIYFMSIFETNHCSKNTWLLPTCMCCSMLNFILLIGQAWLLIVLKVYSFGFHFSQDLRSWKVPLEVILWSIKDQERLLNRRYTVHIIMDCYTWWITWKAKWTQYIGDPAGLVTDDTKLISVVYH